jgi:hypothetical protein
MPTSALVMDRHPYPNPGYRTESPIYITEAVGSIRMTDFPIKMTLNKRDIKSIFFLVDSNPDRLIRIQSTDSVLIHGP